MFTTKPKNGVSLWSIALPVVLCAAFGASIAQQLGYFEPSAAPTAEAPQTVTIPAGKFSYRDHGEFFKAGYAVDAPVVEDKTSSPLSIMKYQVTEQEYGRCVAAGKCQPIAAAHVHGDAYPVTGVSYDDATAYAAWLSAATGEIWHLPSHEQIAHAAGSKFPDDALGVDSDDRNPAIRWLADYDREAKRKAASDPDPRESGQYGENEFGLADFGGNIWEWTTTCQRRIDLADAADAAISTCGIYVTVGLHRSPMSAFVRDPKTGGCSVGAPPANLGFRLIRDDRWYADLLMRLRDRGILS